MLQRVTHRMAGDSQQAFERNVHFDEQIEGGRERHSRDERDDRTAGLQGAL